MKKVALGFISLIGVYTLLRNNVGALPEGLVWTTSPDIFYKVFIPFLMVVSATIGLAKKGKGNHFFLAFGAMCVDATNRLAIGVNHIVLYQRYKAIPQPEPAPGSVESGSRVGPSQLNEMMRQWSENSPFLGLRMMFLP